MTAVPSGVLISTDGRLISGLAVGPDRIREVAAIYARTAAPAAAGSPNGRANGAAPAPRSGQASALPIGSPAPAIELNALAGRKTRLNALGRQPTLLLFFDAAATLCQDIVFDLKGWEAKPPPGAPRLVVIAAGDVRAIRALGLRSRILLDPTFQAVNAFGAVGTPSAVLLDADGRVASPIAYSATSILMLANNQALANPPVDGANRIGLVAPAFEGTRLDGAPIRSADFAGKPTLLLFGIRTAAGASGCCPI